MFKQVTLTNKCLAIVMQRNNDGQNEKSNQHRSSNQTTKTSTPENGFRIFQDFQDENRASFWNPGLVQSINALEYVGFVRPGTLFVSGNELHLECLRGAWARRVLKPPPGFTVKRLGDIGGIEMQEVPQTQFIPLPEVLCLIVSNLNRAGEPATLTKIVSSLTDEYDGMCIPKQEVLYATLGALIAEGKLYCMGEHYFMPTPTMFQYYQQQFLRRPTAPNPPAYLWTKEQEATVLAFPPRSNIQKSQEMCSRECQTGASIVCGQAPYVPQQSNKKDQATSVQTHTSVQTSTVSNLDNEHRRQSQPNKDKGLSNKENKGFLSRLFGRTKPKHLTSPDDFQKHSSKNAPNDHDFANSNTNHLSNDRPSTSGPSSIPQTNIDPTPMATFSAQFPPPEWLCDPRFVKPTKEKDCNQASQPSQQQPFLSKIRRTSKEPQNVNGPSAAQAPNGNRDQQRHSVWVDPIDTIHGKSSNQNFNRREQQQQRGQSQEQKRCFASQRYYYENRQHQQLSPNDNYDRYQQQHRSNKQRHRLSKYLSSSSECLRESPYQSQNKKSIQIDEKNKKSQRHHDRFHSQQQQQHCSVYQFSQPQRNELQQQQNIDENQPLNSNRDDDQSTPRTTVTESEQPKSISEKSKPIAVVVVSRVPPLALPTDPEFDSVSESGRVGSGGVQRTSTPTPAKKCPQLETEINDFETGPIDREPINQLSIENPNGHRDSAYSASPVVTEMSSSDGKYSSWSGSDGQRDNGAQATNNSPESNRDEANVGEKVSESENRRRQIIDNTYVNDTQTRRCALDHTYENLDHANEKSDEDRVVAAASLNATKYENVSNEHLEAAVDVEPTKEDATTKIVTASSIHAYVSSV